MNTFPYLLALRNEKEETLIKKMVSDHEPDLEYSEILFAYALFKRELVVLRRDVLDLAIYQDFDATRCTIGLLCLICQNLKLFIHIPQADVMKIFKSYQELRVFLDEEFPKDQLHTSMLNSAMILVDDPQKLSKILLGLGFDNLHDSAYELSPDSDGKYSSVASKGLSKLLIHSPLNELLTDHIHRAFIELFENSDGSENLSEMKKWFDGFEAYYHHGENNYQLQ